MVIRWALDRSGLSEGVQAGGLDGIVGHLTRAAIRSYQGSRGLAGDGHPGFDLLERLRPRRE